MMKRPGFIRGVNSMRPRNSFGFVPPPGGWHPPQMPQMPPHIPQMPPQMPQIPQVPHQHHHNWQPQPVVINYTQPYYDGGMPYLAPSTLVDQILAQQLVSAESLPESLPVYKSEANPTIWESIKTFFSPKPNTPPPPTKWCCKPARGQQDGYPKASSFIDKHGCAGAGFNWALQCR